MKKLILSALVVLIVFNAFSQNVEISERLLTTKDVPVDALVMVVGKDSDFAKKTFKEYIKQELDEKVEKDSKMSLIASEIQIPSVTTKRGDLLATYFTEGDSTYMGISFLLGYDIFLNSENYETEFSALKEFTRDYQIYHFTKYYESLISKQEEHKKDLDKELSKTERSIGQLRKQIASNDKKIAKSDDTAKKLDINNKSAKNEAEISHLSESIPGIKANIIGTESEISTLRETLYGLLIKIKTEKKTELIGDLDTDSVQ